VLNGTSGRVIAVDHERGQLVLRIESGREVELAAEYLQGQRPDGIPFLMHAYATTAHLAQGATFDRALVMAGDDISREWGYVALSRGREGTRLYVANQASRVGETTREQSHASQREAPLLARVGQALQRSEAKQMAFTGPSLVEDAPPGKDPRKDKHMAWLRRASDRAGAGRPERRHERDQGPEPLDGHVERAP